MMMHCKKCTRRDQCKRHVVQRQSDSAVHTQFYGHTNGEAEADGRRWRCRKRSGRASATPSVVTLKKQHHNGRILREIGTTVIIVHSIPPSANKTHTKCYDSISESASPPHQSPTDDRVRSGLLCTWPQVPPLHVLVACPGMNNLVYDFVVRAIILRKAFM